MSIYVYDLPEKHNSGIVVEVHEPLCVIDFEHPIYVHEQILRHNEILLN